MDRGRILILGRTKENTFEIRSLLDNRRFELEIALSLDVARHVLSSRRMHLIVVHTEALGEESRGFFRFLEDEGITVPVLILGEEAPRFQAGINGAWVVGAFDKPYPLDGVLSLIHSL